MAEETGEPGENPAPLNPINEAGVREALRNAHLNPSLDPGVRNEIEGILEKKGVNPPSEEEIRSFPEQIPDETGGSIRNSKGNFVKEWLKHKGTPPNPSPDTPDGSNQKNIIEEFENFDNFLRHNPEFHEKPKNPGDNLKGGLSSLFDQVARTFSSGSIVPGDKKPNGEEPETPLPPLQERFRRDIDEALGKGGVGNLPDPSDPSAKPPPESER